MQPLLPLLAYRDPKIRVRRSDGKIWHLHVAGRAEMNADGEPQRLRGIARYLVTL
jgi:hypothetical protein